MRACTSMLLITMPLACAFAQSGPNGFVPGHIFLTELGTEWNREPRSWIREVNPTTGESWIFADAEDGLYGNAGLAFTPDGSRLRVANLSSNTVIEFDAAGNGAVILTGANGLTGPFGGNCLAWDTLGRFFVINEYGFQALLRYEYASRNPLVLADWQDGLRGGGGIIVDRNGDVLVASRFLQRVTPDGEVSVIDPYFGSNGFPFARSVAIDRRHNRLYVAADHGVFPRGRIHRYRGFDPGTREMILTGFRPLDTAITIVLSNDDAELLIVDESNLYSVNVETLEQRVLFTAPVEPEFARLLGRGMVIAKAPKPGDMNCDNWVNNFDIDPFVLALTDEAGYAARFGWCDRTRADVNRDGTIDNFDIDAFVAAVIADTGD